MPYSSVMVNLSRNKASALEFLERMHAPIKSKDSIEKVTREMVNFYSGEKIIEEDILAFPKINDLTSDNLKVHIQGHPRDTIRLLVLIAYATNMIDLKEIIKQMREKSEQKHRTRLTK